MSTTKQAVRNELLTGAMVVGLLLALQVVLAYALPKDSVLAWPILILGIAIYATGQLFYGRRVARIRFAEKGSYSYLAALGFTLKMMLLAGIVVGVANWLVIGVWHPELGVELVNQSAAQSLAMFTDPTSEQVALAGQMARAMVSVWGLAIISMFSALLNGGLVGLVTSAFIMVRGTSDVEQTDQQDGKQ